jgi:O-acetyl-ADP-ribose deacetylase (regulator of RNase III)
MVEIVTGDITSLKVDAIVNAANSGLMGGGGVDGAIHRVGGPEILEECRKIRSTTYPNGLPAGEAVVTTGGKLPAAKVIHTVGPVWHGGGSGEPETLANAYRNSLILAEENGFESIAFPAISTGVYGYPKELAGKVAYETVHEFLSNHSLPRKVLFVFFSENDAEAFRNAVL